MCAAQCDAPDDVLKDLSDEGQALTLMEVVGKLRDMGYEVIPVPATGVDCCTMRTADELDLRITGVLNLGADNRRGGPGAHIVSVRARSPGAAAPRGAAAAAARRTASGKRRFWLFLPCCAACCAALLAPIGGGERFAACALWRR